MFLLLCQKQCSAGKPLTPGIHVVANGHAQPTQTKLQAKYRAPHRPSRTMSPATPRKLLKKGKKNAMMTSRSSKWPPISQASNPIEQPRAMPNKSDPLRPNCGSQDLRGCPVVSGTKTVAANPVGCRVEPSWIRLVLAHSTDALGLWQSGGQVDSFSSL